MNTSIKKETIIRTVLLVVALVNQTLVIFGKSPLPVTNDDLTALISTVFTTAVSLWAWWKNNSFTKSAIKADETLTLLKG